MSLDMLNKLHIKSGLPHEEIAKRMGLKLDEYGLLLDGTQRFNRLYVNALERAALAIALEKRDPAILDENFLYKVLKMAKLVLQTYKPNAESDESTE